jgi:hypothetical protein
MLSVFVPLWQKDLRLYLQCDLKVSQIELLPLQSCPMAGDFNPSDNYLQPIFSGFFDV